MFTSQWCRLLAETLGEGEPYYMLDVPDYVSIVARTSEDHLLLVQQYRPVLGRETVELPSGHVEIGETAEVAARRELLEETGMVAGDLDLLGVLSPDVGRLTNRLWYYFANHFTQVAETSSLEHGITLLDVSARDALAMATDGRMDHALNLATLFLAVSKGKLLDLPESENG